MSDGFPSARSPSDPDEREAIRRVIERRGLCGLANDTKWNRFLSAMRAREDWRPSYRCKFVHGRLSDWDVEWFHHFPHPIVIEWLDIVFRFEAPGLGRLLSRQEVDHSAWLVPMVQDAGLDHVKGRTMIRIFGYSPRDMDLFDD